MNEIHFNNELENQEFNNLLSKANDVKIGNDYNEFLDTLISEYNKTRKIEPFVVEICNLLINMKDYENANKLISLLTKRSIKNNNSRYLKRKIEEQEYYDKMSEDLYNKILLYLNNGKSCLIHEDYYNAYNYFMAGKYLTNDRIFDYYLGKTYYKCKNYKVAKKYFEEYAKLGYWKLGKCYFYLSFIEKKFHGKYNKYREKYEILVNTDPDIADGQYLSVLKDVSLIMDTKKEKDFDKVKFYKHKFIDIELEDFIKNDDNIKL